MTPAFVVFVGPLLAIMAVASTVALVNVFHWPEPRRREEVEAFARAADLATHPDVVPAVGERLVRRRRYLGTGLLLGVLVWLAYLIFAGVWKTHFPNVVLVAFAMCLSGYCAQLVAVSAMHAVRVRGEDRTGTRVAHARSTQIVDYVTPLEVYASRVLAVLPLVVAGIWTVVPRRASASAEAGVHADPRLVTATAVASLTTLAISEVLQRAIVRAPQPAHSVQALAFDDALRAQALRDALNLPLVLPAIALIYNAGAIADTAQSGSVANVFTGVQVAALAAMFASAALSSAAQKKPRYRQRLWAPVPAGREVHGR